MDDKRGINTQISNGKAEVGVILLEDDFQILVGVDSPNVNMLKQIIEDAYVSRDHMNEFFKRHLLNPIWKKKK